MLYIMAVRAVRRTIEEWNGTMAAMYIAESTRTIEKFEKETRMGAAQTAVNVLTHM